MALKVIPTVTTAAPSFDLTTLATFLDDYDIENTVDSPAPISFISRTITRCSISIEKYCNRRFAQETVVDTIYSDRDPYPYQTPGGSNPLQLSRWPVQSVTSVEQYDAGTPTTLTQGTPDLLVDGVDYQLSPGSGQLIRLDSFGEQMTWPAVVYLVTYSAGYVLPSDPWVTGQLYLPGAVANNAGNLYQTVAGGTSGATAPTGTGTGISDGTVIWNYVAASTPSTLPADIEDAVGRMVNARYLERKRDPFIRSKAIGTGGTTSYWGSVAGSGAMSQDVLDILDKHRVPVTA